MSNGTNAGSIATVLKEGSEEIARRWLERVAARVAIDREFVFPSEDLLDGIPLLVEGLGRLLSDPSRDLTIDLPVILKARELGQLRYAQGFNARQILWEYDLLGSIIIQYADEAVAMPPASDLVSREYKLLFRALAAIQRATMEEYLVHAEEQISEREERLRAFNRALTHELRNDLGAILGAARMLREPFIMQIPERHEQFVDMIVQNGERIEVVLANLLELARMDLDARRNRNVLLEHATREVIRRLRDFAEVSGVRVVIGTLPRVEVNAAAIDFCLTNLISNGIKYSDTTKPDRWVMIQGSVVRQPDHDAVLVEVIDNGRGVPEIDRPRLFERYFRADNATGQEGTGLGLSLVREFIERIGGRAWAEFTDDHSIFAFTIPARRTDDEGPPN